jgi:hypothetical protein
VEPSTALPAEAFLDRRSLGAGDSEGGVDYFTS